MRGTLEAARVAVLEMGEQAALRVADGRRFEAGFIQTTRTETG